MTKQVLKMTNHHIKYRRDLISMSISRQQIAQTWRFREYEKEIRSSFSEILHGLVCRAAALY